MRAYLLIFLFLCSFSVEQCLANGVTAWSKDVWMEEALKSLTGGRYPRVKALSYWHERWMHDDGVVSDLRIDSSPESLAVYRRYMSSSLFVNRPSFSFGPTQVLLPPLVGMYVAAFPGFGSTEDRVSSKRLARYEELASKPITWAYFSNNWYDGIEFPEAEISAIHGAGRVPFVRLMMRSRSQTLPDPKYNLQDFVDGKYDEALYKWAERAAAVGIPMILEFGTEANGDWFPWSGKWNGAGAKDNFWSDQLSDGPERFQHAFRHIVRIFREVGVPNVTWVFHVDAFSAPEEPWNRLENYYPGEGWVDWIGVSVYGPIRPGEEKAESFRSLMDKIYPRLTALSSTKPIAILEWGISENPHK